MSGEGILYLSLANAKQVYLKCCRVAKHYAENVQT